MCKDTEKDCADEIGHGAPSCCERPITDSIGSLNCGFIAPIDQNDVPHEVENDTNPGHIAKDISEDCIDTTSGIENNDPSHCAYPNTGLTDSLDQLAVALETPTVPASPPSTFRHANYQWTSRPSTSTRTLGEWASHPSTSKCTLDEWDG